MDVSAFYTQTAAGNTSKAAALSGSGAGKSAAGGIDAFLDLLLSTINPAGIAAAGKNAGAQGGNGTDDQSLKDILASLPEDASAQDILAALKKAGIQDTTIAQFLAGLDGDSALKAKDDALDIIRDILDGASQDDLAAISALLTANDNTPATGTTLNVSKKDILDTLDSLVSSGLTPAQISELAEKLRALKAEKGEAMDAAFLASLLGQNQTTAAAENAQSLSTTESDTRALLARALAAGKNDASSKSGDATKPTATDLIAAINGALEKKNLIGPAPDPSATDAENALLSADAGDAKGKMLSFAGGPETLVPRTQTQSHAAATANGLGASGNAATDGAQPLLSASAGWSSGEESFQDWIERISGTSILASSGQSLTTAGTSATTPTLAGGGVQTASQVVAASIFRAAQGGESRTMTLHLDPPELGRVAIKLEMDKNRTLKTVLTIEKPETHSLLQRDAHLLERALQNAGIDVSGGESLSFELAGDGFSFDRGSGQSGGQGASSGPDGTENAGILETRMDWYVDPDTGLQRYDIVV